MLEEKDVWAVSLVFVAILDQHELWKINGWMEHFVLFLCFFSVLCAHVLVC